MTFAREAVRRIRDVGCPVINHLSLCAGYGGIDLALRRVLPSCRTIAYVEIEAFAIASLVAKMEEGLLDSAPVWTDIKTFNAEPFRGLVDIVSGGYPCTPFSWAGLRQGSDDKKGRHLWPFLRRAMRVVQPGRVFLENVEGHITLGLSTVLSDLEEDGYRSAWGIYSAAEVGSTHRRKRVFILGELAITDGERGEGSVQPVGGPGQAGQWLEAIAPDCLAPLEWPAPPGAAQLEWEEPRVLADTNDSGGGKNLVPAELRAGGAEQSSSDRGQGKEGEAEEVIQGCAGTGQGCPASNEGQAQPKLGGATDAGSPRGRVDTAPDPLANRTDRLRLLGNGVVPATAAKAFIELSMKLEAMAA